MRAILQRHGKIIMTILGVVLMFVFALPAFRTKSDDERSREAIGTLNGRKVTAEMITQAQRELDLLERFPAASHGTGSFVSFLRHPNFWRTAFALQSFAGQDREQGLYWYLLREDARKYIAVSVSEADLTNLLAEMGLTDRDVDTALGVGGRQNSNGLPGIITDLEMVESYLEFLLQQPRPVAAIELSADAELKKVQVSFAAFDGVQDWQKGVEPTDDQIKKQFDLYKGVLRTPIPEDPTSLGPQPQEIAGHHYPFGYKYPDRVAVEYLLFNRAAVRALTKPSGADYDAAFAFYQEHPQEFRNPASQPGVVTTQPAIKPWEEVQQELVNRQIDRRVDDLIKKMINAVFDRTRANVSLPRAQWVSYTQVAEALAQNPAFGYKPEVKNTGRDLPRDFKSAVDLSKIEGIGKAVYTVAEQGISVPLPVLAVNVRELVEPDPKSFLGRLDLQTGVEGPVVQDAERNVYIYRVTDINKSHEPEKLDEVRPLIIEDFKKMDAYEKRVAQIRDALAKDPNIQTLAQQMSVKVQTPAEFSRIETDLPPEIRGIRDFVKSAFSLTEKSASSATSRPTSVRSTLLENQDTLRCVALELEKVSPATGADFASKLPQLHSEPDLDLVVFIRNYLSLDSLQSRLNYKPTLAPSKPKEEKSPESAPSTSK